MCCVYVIGKERLCDKCVLDAVIGGERKGGIRRMTCHLKPAKPAAKFTMASQLVKIILAS